MRGLLYVKLQLPDGQRIDLDENITLDEKIVVVTKLTEKWQSIIESNWKSNSIRFFLDGLANYLVWHKELDKKNKQDKDVLSITKVEEMSGKRRGKTTPFSSLPKVDQELLFGEVLNDG